ncbi:MAG: hypothetical protein HY399_03235 [Elusimicrobia bacterium]|nr:hypothetical protein [Elusimicrobiota bacterium]
MESENEYSHLENLVQDVTNIDTARMTLRWALEKLHGLERSNRELEEKLKTSTDLQHTTEKKMKEMEEVVASRTKLLQEQELFYQKMEETLRFLTEGKIDVPALMHREVNVERIRREVSEEYQKQFEEMDRSNHEMISRWTERLLQVESHYPEKLTEVLQKYDELRHEQDQLYQGRLLKLEQSFHAKEEELLRREQELETDYQKRIKGVEELRIQLQNEGDQRANTVESGYQSLKDQVEQEVEKRRQGLEAEYQTKRTQLETEMERARTGLHQNFRLQTEQWGQEQLQRMSALQQTWDLERQRLLEEQKSREEQFQKAQKQIQALEELLASADVKHREELLRRLADTEASFQVKVQEFEKVQTEAKAALSERERVLETGHRLAKSDLEKSYQVKKAALEAEWEQRRVQRETEWSSEKEKLLQELDRRKVETKTAEEARLQAEKFLLEGHRSLAEKAEKLEAEYSSRKVELEQGWKQQAEVWAKEAGERYQAREETWRLEREGMIQQLEARESSIRDLTHQLEGVRDHLIQASAQSQAAQEGLKTQLTQQFEEVLKSRQAEEISRRKAWEESWQTEKERLLGELGRREGEFKGAQGEIRQLQESLDQQKKGLEQEKLALLRKLDDQELSSAHKLKETEKQIREEGLKTLESEYSVKKAALEKAYEDKLTAYRSDQEKRFKSSEEAWLQERQRLLSEIQSQRDGIQKLSLEMSALREARSQEVLSNETKRIQWEDAFRKQFETQVHQLEVSFQEKLKGVESDYVARKADLEQGWKQQAEAWSKEEAERYRAREETWRLEREGMLKQLEARESSIRDLTHQLEGVRDSLVQASTQSQTLQESLKTQLTQQFEQVLKTRETEEASRRQALEASWQAERGRLLEEVGHRENEFKQAQAEIRKIREAIDQERIFLNKQWEDKQQELEKTLHKNHEEKVLALRSEQERRFKVTSETWDHDKNRLLSEIQSQQKTIEGLTREISDLRNIRVQEELTKESERTQSEETARKQFEEQLRNLEKSLEARKSQLESDYALRKKEIAEDLEKIKTDLQQSYQARTQALEMESLARQKSLEESWSRGREGYLKELTARETVIQDLSDQLKKSRESLIQWSTQSQSAQEGLRTQLTREFEEKLKSRELEEALRCKALEESWRAERDRMVGEVGRREEEFKQAQGELRHLSQSIDQQRAAWEKEETARRRALEAAWKKEKEDLISEFEREYEDKKEKLLSACEMYRKELEAREEALKSREAKRVTRGEIL